MSMKREVVSRTIAGILAGIAIAVIFWFWASVQPWIGVPFVWAWSVIVGSWNWLVAEVYMPRWVFLILASVAGIATARKIWSLRRQRAQPKEPSETDFVEIERFGIVWRWHWQANRVKDLNGYCPRCDRLMRYREDDDRYHPLPTEYFCTNCPNILIRREGDYSQTANYVMIEIDHAIRSGEWRQHLKIAEEKRQLKEMANAE